MSVSTESNKSQSESILDELDELMDYMSEDSDAQQQDDLIDPAFFIGDFQDSTQEVPTLTSIADGVPIAPEPEKNDERQPGIFSSRVAEIKRAQEAEARDSSQEKQLDKLVDEMVAEYLPRIEAQLREKIRLQLKAKK